MKIIFSLLFSLTAQLAFAQSLEECVGQASNIDPTVGAPVLLDSCKAVIAETSYQNARDFTDDNYIQAFAAGNILYTIQYAEDTNGNPQLNIDGLSAGKFTSFDNIKALEIDETNNRIYLLDEELDGSFSVVSVPADKAGSLAPSSKIFSRELNNAVNLKLDPAQSELYIMGENWIKVFNLQAYSGSFRPEQSDKVLRKLEGNNTGLENIKDLTTSEDKVYVLDGSRVLSFPKNNTESDISSELILEVPVESVEIEVISDALQITLEDGSTIQFQI